MYTANTMASAIEALGMSLPGSSSFPAESQEKHDECASIGPVMYNLLEKNILPREIMTRSAFENAMVCSFFFHPAPPLFFSFTPRLFFYYYYLRFSP